MDYGDIRRLYKEKSDLVAKWGNACAERNGYRQQMLDAVEYHDPLSELDTKKWRIDLRISLWQKAQVVKQIDNRLKKVDELITKGLLVWNAQRLPPRPVYQDDED